MKQSSNQYAEVGEMKSGHFKWGKCELVKTNYVPFCAAQPAPNQVRQKITTNYLNYKFKREKISIFTEKPKIALKI
jgi:hypothetical protein